MHLDASSVFHFGWSEWRRGMCVMLHFIACRKERRGQLRCRLENAHVPQTNLKITFIPTVGTASWSLSEAKSRGNSLEELVSGNIQAP